MRSAESEVNQDNQSFNYILEPIDSDANQYRRKTKELINSLLGKICSLSDTYEEHRKIVGYTPFLDIQLELVTRIVATERRIIKLKNERTVDLRKIAETKERRAFLKLLGTTIAWILLEFDRPYIRNFATGSDPGFISGKKGLKLEILVLKTVFKIRNYAAILHDITNCLRLGDLSVVSPKGVQTLELKLRQGKGKPSRRERRQKRKGKIIREFYDKGISTKIIPGLTSVRRISKARDKHNWNEMSAVVKEAIEKECGIRLVEKCLIYCAFKNETSNGFENELARFMRRFKKPYVIHGCHDRHIAGIADIMPFTCFEIPLLHKEKLLFGEVNFCVILEINSLRRVMEKNGFRCRILKDKAWILEVSNRRGKLGSMKVGFGLISRLLYECLSVKTFMDYAKGSLAFVRSYGGVIEEG